jgi:ribonuclease PH
VDMNFVMTGRGNLVEVQASAEAKPFTDDQLHQMMSLAKSGVQDLISKQRAILKKLKLAAEAVRR